MAAKEFLIKALSIAVFLVCLSQGAYGITCLFCNDVESLSQCSEIIECPPNKTCNVQKSLSMTTFKPVYSAGCADVHECNLIKCSKDEFSKVVPTSSHHGSTRAPHKREDNPVVCTECCYNDTCNTKGCGGNFQDATSNDARQCFKCTHQRGDTAACKEFSTCQTTETCGYQYHVGDDGYPFYELLCLKKDLCDFLQLQSNLHPDLNLTSKCCNEHLCNQSPYKTAHTSQTIFGNIPCPTDLVQTTTTPKPTTTTTTTTPKPTTPTTTTTTTTTTPTPTTTTTTPKPTTTTTTTPKPTTTTTPTPKPTTTTTTTTTPKPTTTTTTTTTPKPTTTTTTSTTPKPTTTSTTTTTTPTPTTTTTTSTTPKPTTTTTSTPKPTTTTTTTTTPKPTTTTTTTTPKPTTTTTTTTPAPTTTTTTPKPTTTTTTPKPTTTTTTPAPTTTTTTTTPKPTTTTTTTTTPKPTTTTTTPKPTTTTTTTTTTTPTPTTTPTTPASTTKAPANVTYSTASITCEVCAGPVQICETLHRPQTCVYPNNFCINHLVNLDTGGRTVTRKCGDIDTCVHEWYQGTSDNDRCTTFDPHYVQTLDFECVFCCTKDGCNKPVVPAKDSLFKN